MPVGVNGVYDGICEFEVARLGHSSPAAFSAGSASGAAELKTRINSAVDMR